MDLKQYKQKLLKTPKFRAEYEKRDLAREIARLIIQVRVIRGITQEKLAKMIKSKQPSIARLENGNSLPSLSFLNKIAKAFNTNVNLTFEFIKDEYSKNQLSPKSEFKKGQPSPRKGIKKPGWINNGSFKRGIYAGENHYAWKGGITPLVEQIRKSFEYRQWRSDIFTRDNFTCVICDKRGGFLEADHYPKKFSEIFWGNDIRNLTQAIQCEEFWNINNGRTLCKECHNKTKRKIWEK